MKQPITKLEDIPDEVVIQTVSGLYFQYNDPCFVIGDIAHALGMLCRYNGHCKEFYSVADHSIMVAEIMEFLGDGDPLEGLLHDATEAYLSDVPAPVKKVLDDVVNVDGLLDERFRAEHFLPRGKSSACHRADMIALFIEGWDLVADKGTGFADPLGIRELSLDMKHRFPLQYRQNKEAREAFLEKYEELIAVLS